MQPQGASVDGTGTADESRDDKNGRPIICSWKSAWVHLHFTWAADFLIEASSCSTFRSLLVSHLSVLLPCVRALVRSCPCVRGGLVNASQQHSPHPPFPPGGSGYTIIPCLGAHAARRGSWPERSACRLSLGARVWSDLAAVTLVVISAFITVVDRYDTAGWTLDVPLLVVFQCVCVCVFSMARWHQLD